MNKKIKKFISFLLVFCFLFQQTGFAQVAPQLNIAGYMSQLRNSFVQDKFRPLHLRYLSYDNLQNNFKLFLDKGDLRQPDSKQLEGTTDYLLSYFLVGVSLPNESFWVNLRPDSPNNVIDSYLAKTDVGKILLEADLQLKKDTALATSPSTPEGKEYWNRLYKKAGELFGPGNVTIPTLTRPWIVPGDIIISETETNAYIYKATLKVMLEQDYLKGSSVYKFDDQRMKTLNEYASELIRELIIPKLNRDINNAKRYAPLRQVYYSLIMAQWFKNKFEGRPGLYSRLINTKNLKGLTSKKSWNKDAYFKEYQKSFKEGEYNIKEPVYSSYGQMFRNYFSGGIMLSLGAGSGMGVKPPVVVECLRPRDNPEKINFKTGFAAQASGGSIDSLSPSETEIITPIELLDETPSLVETIQDPPSSLNTEHQNVSLSQEPVKEPIIRRSFIAKVLSALAALGVAGSSGASRIEGDFYIPEEITIQSQTIDVRTGQVINDEGVVNKLKIVGRTNYVSQDGRRKVDVLIVEGARPSDGRGKFGHYDENLKKVIIYRSGIADFVQKVIDPALAGDIQRVGLWENGFGLSVDRFRGSSAKIIRDFFEANRFQNSQEFIQAIEKSVIRHEAEHAFRRVSPFNPRLMNTLGAPSPRFQAQDTLEEFDARLVDLSGDLAQIHLIVMANLAIGGADSSSTFGIGIIFKELCGVDLFSAVGEQQMRQLADFMVEFSKKDAGAARRELSDVSEEIRAKYSLPGPLARSFDWAEQILVVGVLTAVNPSLGSLVLSRRNLLGLKGDTKSAASSPVGSQNKKDSLIARRGFLGRIGLVVAALLFGRVSPAGESRGLFGLFSADELPQKLADELEKIAGESTHPDIGTSGFWRSRFQTDDLTAMRMARLYRQHAEPVRSLQHSQSQSVFIRAVAGSIRNEQRRFLENRKDGLFEKDGRIYRIISTTLYTSKDGSQKAQVLRVVAPAGETSGNWFGVHYFQLGNVVIINNTAINEGVKNQLMPLVSGNIPAGSSREGISDALAKELNSALSGILSKALGSMSEQEVGQVVEDYLIEHEAEHLFNENINFMSSVLSSRAFRNKAEVLLQKVLGVQDISEETEVIADELDAQLTELSGSYPQLWLMPSGEDTHPDSSVRSLIWGELCGFDIRAGNRNEGNLRRVRDFLSRLSRQDRVQVRTFLNNKSRQIRAKYSLPDSLASINNLAAPFFVGAGITAIRSTVNSPNLSRRAFLSLGAADKQSTSSPVDSALSARDAASEDNVWPSIIRMSTEANRLEYSLSAVDELSQSLQIRRPVIYDIGVEWAGEGGPVTTRELADTLKGRAQVFGIDKQIPYCVVYTPELTVLFDENNNILSWNRHQDNRLVFHTGETLSAAQKAEALDLVTGLRAAAERTLAKRISDFLRRALGMQGAYEYKSGKNRIVFNPIKSYENKNLKFAKGDLFNLGDSLGAQGLPRADIVRISNVLMPHFISKRESRQQNMSAMSEVLNSLLPFTQESGYVIVTYVPTEGIVPLSPGEEGVVYRKHNGRFIFDGYIFSVRTAVYANLGNIADFASQQAFDSPVKKANLLGEAVNEAGRRDAELWEFLTTGGTRKFGHGAELDAAEKEFNRKFGEVIVDVLATHGIQAQAWGSMVRVSYEDYSAQDTSMKKDFMGAIRKDFLDKGMPLDVGVAQEILRPLAVASSPIDEQGSEQGDGALPEMHFNLSAPRAAARNAVAILNPEQIHEMDLGVAMIVRHIQTKAPFIYTRWLRNLGFTPVANARQLYSDMSYIASGNNKHAYYTEVVDEKGNRDSFIFATKLNTDRNEALFESGEQDMLERLQGTPWVPRFAGVAYIEINPNGGFGEVYTDHRYIRTERMATVAVEELIEGPTVASIADANANLSIDIAKKCLASLLNIFFFLNEGRSGNFEGPSDFHFNNIIISERDGKQIAVVVDLGPKKQYRNLEDFVLEIMQWYGDDKAGQALGALYDIDNWPGKYSRSAYFWDSWLKDFSAYCHSHNNRRYRKFAYIVDRFLLHERGINLFRGGRNREPGPSSASSPVSLRETVLMGLDAIGRAITEGSVLIKTGDREEDTFVLTRRQLIAGSIAGLGTIFGAGVGLSLLGGKNRQQVSYAPKPPDPATVSVETQIFSWDQGYDQNAQAYLDFENRTSLPAELQHSRYGVNRSGNHNLNNLYYAAMYALLAGVDPVFAIAHYIQEGRTDFGGNYIVQGRAVDGDFWRDTVAPRYLKAHEGQDVKNNPSIDDIVLDPLVGPFVYRRILEEKLVDYPNQLARKGNDFVAVPDAKTIEQAAKSLQLYQGWGWVSKAQTGRKSIDYTKGENKYQYGYSLLALMSLLQQGDNKAIVDDIISRAQEAVPARLREILGELNGTQSVFKIDVAKLKSGASSPITSDKNMSRREALGLMGRGIIAGVVGVNTASGGVASAQATDTEKMLDKQLSEFDYIEQNARASILKNLLNDFPELSALRDRYSHGESAEVIVRELSELMSSRYRLEAGELPADLRQVATSKSGNCIGSSQLFQILAGAIGLDVSPIEVKRTTVGSEIYHVASLVRLKNGEALEVDLAVKSVGVRGPFKFSDYYQAQGKFYNLQERYRGQELHWRIRMLTLPGLLAFVDINDDNYDSAIRRDPDSAWVYAQRGEYYKGAWDTDPRRDYAKAESDYKEALKRDPDFIFARRGLARVYEWSNRPKEAIDEFTVVIKRLESYIPDELTRKGEIANGDYAGSLELLASVYASRARIYQKMGDKARAEKDLARVREISVYQYGIETMVLTGASSPVTEQVKQAINNFVNTRDYVFIADNLTFREFAYTDKDLSDRSEQPLFWDSRSMNFEEARGRFLNELPVELPVRGSFYTSPLSSMLIEVLKNAYDAVLSRYDLGLRQSQIDAGLLMDNFRGGVAVSFVINNNNLVITVFDNGAGIYSATNAHKREAPLQRPYLGGVGGGRSLIKSETLDKVGGTIEENLAGAGGRGVNDGTQIVISIPLAALVLKERAVSSPLKEEVLAQLGGADYTPQGLIQALKNNDTLRWLYAKDAGVWQGYSVEEHTLMVLGEFEKYFSSRKLPAGIDVRLMRLVLALHDIGKPFGGQDKASQDYETRRVIQETMAELPFDNFSSEQTRIMLAIINGDPLGQYLQHKISAQAAASQIKEMVDRSGTKDAGVSLQDFFRLLVVYYQSDAASYTEDAGGDEYLEALFKYESPDRKLFNQAESRIEFSDEIEGVLQVLVKELGLANTAGPASSPVSDEVKQQAAATVKVETYLGMIGNIGDLEGLGRAVGHFDMYQAQGYLQHIDDEGRLDEIYEALLNKLKELVESGELSEQEKRSIFVDPSRYLGRFYPLQLSNHLSEIDALLEKVGKELSAQHLADQAEERSVAQIKRALGEYILSRAGSGYIIDDAALDSLAWRIYRVQGGGFNIQELNIRDLSSFPGVLSEADIPSLSELGKTASSPVSGEGGASSLAQQQLRKDVDRIIEVAKSYEPLTFAPDGSVRLIGSSVPNSFFVYNGRMIQVRTIYSSNEKDRWLSVSAMDDSGGMLRDVISESDTWVWTVEGPVDEDKKWLSGKQVSGGSHSSGDSTEFEVPEESLVPPFRRNQAHIRHIQYTEPVFNLSFDLQGEGVSLRSYDDNQISRILFGKRFDLFGEAVVPEVLYGIIAQVAANMKPFIENPELHQTIEQIEDKLKPRRYSTEGFLAEDERLWDVITRDNKILADAGVTHDEIADLLNRIISVSESSHTQAVSINSVEFSVVRTGTHGIQVCPWHTLDAWHRHVTGSVESKRYESFGFLGSKYRGGGSSDYSITNVRTQETVDVPDMAPHLIGDHHFFEGNTAYRMDPEKLIRVLGLGSVASASSPVRQRDVDLAWIEHYAQELTVQGSPEFLPGGINSQEAIRSITGISGVAISEINRRAQRGVRSQTGFADDVIEQMVIDNATVDRLGATHKELSGFLRLAIEKIDDNGRTEFEYNGMKFEIQAFGTRTPQDSIFSQSVWGSYYVLINKTQGTTMSFAPNSVSEIAQLGFYEARVVGGQKNSYAVDPALLWTMFRNRDYRAPELTIEEALNRKARQMQEAEGWDSATVYNVDGLASRYPGLVRHLQSYGEAEFYGRRDSFWGHPCFYIVMVKGDWSMVAKIMSVSIDFVSEDTGARADFMGGGAEFLYKSQPIALAEHFDQELLKEFNINGMDIVRALNAPPSTQVDGPERWFYNLLETQPRDSLLKLAILSGLRDPAYSRSLHEIFGDGFTGSIRTAPLILEYPIWPVGSQDRAIISLERQNELILMAIKENGASSPVSQKAEPWRDLIIGGLMSPIQGRFTGPIELARTRFNMWEYFKTSLKSRGVNLVEHLGNQEVVLLGGSLGEGELIRAEVPSVGKIHIVNIDAPLINSMAKRAYDMLGSQAATKYAFYNKDIAELGDVIAEHSIGLVTSFGVIEFLDNNKAVRAVKTAERLLAPGGIALINDAHDMDKPRDLREVISSQAQLLIPTSNEELFAFQVASSPVRTTDSAAKNKVVVFVLDTGVTLAGVRGDKSDGSYHGTSVAALIRKGAPNAEIRSINIFKGASSYTFMGYSPSKQEEVLLDSLLAGALDSVIAYKKNNPKDRVLVNMSIGAYKYRKEHEERFNELRDLGVVIICPSGNDGGYGISSYPAKYRATIVVGANDIGFSTKGRGVDIYASGQLNKLSGGTSFAAPRITGLIARMLSGNDSLAPGRAWEIVKSTSDSDTHDVNTKAALETATHISNVPTQGANVKKDAASSSPSMQDKGGIDFRALPIVTQSVPIKPLNLSPTVNFNHNAKLDKDWQEIENMINGGIIPSSERLKEYLSKCCKEDCLEGEIDRVLACVAQILRLEEERVTETDSSVKELLVLLESNKSAQELKYDLIEISVSPKEPKRIE